MVVRPGKDGVISQQMSATVMSTGRPFTKLIKDSAMSFAQKRVLCFEVMPDLRSHYHGIWFLE